MQNLVKIENREIGAEKVNSVNARDLHKVLESKQDFSTWIKKRIEKYGFEETTDFISFHKVVEREVGATKQIEYIITLDMAKELAMVENNPKGREARRYFIEVEKRARVQKSLFDIDGKSYCNVINGYKSQIVQRNKIIAELKLKVQKYERKIGFYTIEIEESRDIKIDNANLKASMELLEFENLELKDKYIIALEKLGGIQ